MFNLNIEPSCTYCRDGEYLGRDEIACVRHGIVDASGYCKKFRYEPTKRVPQISPRLDASRFSAADFSLSEPVDAGKPTEADAPPEAVDPDDAAETDDAVETYDPVEPDNPDEPDETAEPV